MILQVLAVKKGLYFTSYIRIIISQYKDPVMKCHEPISMECHRAFRTLCSHEVPIKLTSKSCSFTAP